MNLTPKQARFCEEYLVDCNGRQAAIRAGYSRKTANQIASQNLAKLNIQNRIREMQQEASKRLRISADRVLNEIAKVAFEDSHRDGDKLKACEMLGKHLGLFTEKYEVTETSDKPQVVVYLPDNGREIVKDGSENSGAAAR